MLRETLALTGLLAADLLHAAACALIDRIGGRGGDRFHVHVAPWRVEAGVDQRCDRLFLASLPYSGDGWREQRGFGIIGVRRYGRLVIVRDFAPDGGGETYLLDAQDEQVSSTTSR